MIAGIGRVVAVLGVLTAPLAHADGQKRGMLPEDYFATVAVNDPQLSPDGKLVAYTVTTVDTSRNGRHTAVWVAATDGSRPPQPFTTGPVSSSSPRWSPDGRSLAFVSARPSEKDAATDTPRAQLHLLSMDGGEARRVTSLKNGVSAYAWSPDGTRLGVVSRVGTSDSQTIKDRTDDQDPRWSPDGKRIAFVSNRTGKALEQGEQWFRALRHFGVTAEFVIFPRENHNQTRTGEPRHLVDSMRWQLYWFDRFLNGNAAAQPPYEAPGSERR